MFWALYIGPMLAFAVLLTFREHIKSLSDEHLVRAFQSYGAPFGLSFGTLIFLLLYSRWQQYGEFNLYWSTTSDQYQSIAIIIGIIVWLSNLVLEVWTLDPLRKMDNTPNDTKYKEALKSFHRHLVFHVGVLSASSILYIYGSLEAVRSLTI
jgi:hypothetical protein